MSFGRAAFFWLTRCSMAATRSGVKGFGTQDRKKVETDAAPFGSNVKFEGFDCNGETNLMGVARFLVDDMDRFQQFQGRDMNSHFPSIDTYRRMLDVFEPIRAIAQVSLR